MQATGTQIVFNWKACFPTFNSETAKNFGKVTGVALTILGAGTLAYSNPVFYSWGMLGVTAGSTYAVSKAFVNFSKAEHLQYMIACALLISGVAISGGVVGLSPFLAQGFLQAVAVADFESILFYGTIITGTIGNLGMVKNILIKADEVFKSTEIAQSLGRWIKFKSALPNSLRNTDTILLAACSCFPHLFSSVRTIMSNKAIMAFNAIHPQPFEGVLELLELAFICSSSTGDREEQLKSLFPLIYNTIDRETQPEERNKKIVAVTEMILKCSSGPASSLCGDFFLKYKADFLAMVAECLEVSSNAQLGMQFGNFKIKVLNPSDNTSLDDLKKEMSALRNDLTLKASKAKKYLDLMEKNWIPNDSQLKLQKLLTSCNSALKELNEQRQDQSSLLDKVQLRLNQATKEQVLDLDDTVWNFMLMNSIATMDELQLWTGVSLNELDECLEKMGIGTLEQLIKTQMITEEQLKTDKALVKDKVKAYIEAKRAPDSRSSIYNFLGSVRQAQWSPSLLQADQVAARVTYRAVLIFNVMAPIVAYPTHALAGVACGIVYPIVDAILQQRISNFAELFLINARRNASILLRREVFVLDPASLQDQERFVQANLFGRMRLMSFETLLGYLLFTMDLNQFLGSHRGRMDVERINAGAFVQTFMWSQNLTQRIGTYLHNTIKARLRPAAELPVING